MGVDDTISLDSGVELRGEIEQFDPATYVASAVFNAVAFPANMPEYLKRHIEAEAAFAQRLDDAGMTIGGANGGPIGEMTKAERNKKAGDEAADYLSILSEKFEREEREREEWSHTVSTVAGVSMTGKEWAQLAERLRNDEDLHRRLIEIYRARGMTGAEAEARYDRIAEVATIAAIPPSQRTEAQKVTMKDANSEPSIGRDLADARTAMSKNDLPAPSGFNTAFGNAASGSDAAVAAAPANQPAPKPATTVVSNLSI